VHAINLAANQLLLCDPGRPEPNGVKQKGSVHGDSVGLHASDAQQVGTNFRGKGVHEAARIAALAGSGEIVASAGTVGESQRVSDPRSVELKGLSGTRIVRVASLPPGWMLKSVRVNGNDITDAGMDFKAGEAVTGIDVVLTSKLTEVNGTVKAGSAPAKDYTLVIFSDEPQKWSIPNTRYVAGTRPDQEGRFQVKNLPAGGYYAIAVDYLAQGEWNDPDVLERLKPKATSFSIDEGETKTLALMLR